jgi:transketolase C-terminal domain/subunit
MRDYYLVWLIASGLAIAGALTVIAVGSYLLRRVVEDMSNSTSQSAYVLRLFRIGPGVALIVFGGVLLWKIVYRILSLALPT